MARRVITYPRIRKDPLAFDIALIKNGFNMIISHSFERHIVISNKLNLERLSKPATLNQYVQPVALPTRCASVGTMCKATGWGNTLSYWDDSGGFSN